MTVGLRPTYPESGFGYIRLGAAISASGRCRAGTVDVFAVDRFVEKPTWELARDYVASGEYLWNSGHVFSDGGPTAA